MKLVLGSYYDKGKSKGIKYNIDTNRCFCDNSITHMFNLVKI